MTNLDQFESVFKSADKAVFTYERAAFNRILLVSDMDTTAAEGIAERVRAFLSTIEQATTDWSILTGKDFDSIQSLLERIEEHKPDLIVTYRHLHSAAWQWPHSLGEYLDVMTQATSVPVLVLPHPDANYALPHTVSETSRVMAITDHLTGDSQLVNIALAFTKSEGSCWLTHVESQIVFDRYLESISKVPALDTEIARETLHDQLLKEPKDFIKACRVVIEQEDVAVQIEEFVTMGEPVEQYGKLIDDHKIDLLVLHTKDEDQLAMHGAAYALAVELRAIPLLML